MSKIFCTLTLLAMFVHLASAQDGKPPVALTQNHRVSFVQPTTEGPAPPFCPPKTCLYYAGDWGRFGESDADGLYNADDIGSGIEGEAWVGVKPDRDVVVTGASAVIYLTSGFTVTNPTPFAIQVGIQPGQAGKTICSSAGNAKVSYYIGTDAGIFYSYTIKRLSKSCHLKKGKLYYVNLLPTSQNGYGYLIDVPPKPLNHYGWKNDPNHCYFNGAAFGADYATCNSQGPFSEFSIALTGKEKK